MQSKRCQICGCYRRMNTLSVCCYKCEEIELDLLISVYAFIHLTGSEYCPAKDIINNVRAIKDIKVNTMFLRSWVIRKWLQKNEMEALRVPPPIEEKIQIHGFTVTPELIEILEKLKENKPDYDPQILQVDFETKSNRIQQNTGMVFMDRKRK